MNALPIRLFGYFLRNEGVYLSCTNLISSNQMPHWPYFSPAIIANYRINGDKNGHDFLNTLITMQYAKPSWNLTVPINALLQVEITIYWCQGIPSNDLFKTKLSKLASAIKGHVCHFTVDPLELHLKFNKVLKPSNIWNMRKPDCGLRTTLQMKKVTILSKWSFVL